MIFRIGLFLATNFAIVLVLAVVSEMLGLRTMLAQGGFAVELQVLLISSAVIGFVGAFISLAISKWLAIRMTGAQVITQPGSATERWLVETVARQARQCNIHPPEVAIFPAAEPNAFATGMRRNRSLVAVSQGLLQNMDRGEVEAVLGHEVSHVANGDMVSLTLIQGVVNTFVIFLSRVIGIVVDRVVLKNRDGYGPGYWITSIVAQIVLGILASAIVMWFSRRREFRADIGGARLAGRDRMIGALEALKRGSQEDLPEQLAAFGISGQRKGNWKQWFASHPPLEDRIQALRERG